MISRRGFLKWIGALGVLGAATASYAFAIEPLMRLRITRYQIAPPRWPQGLRLTIAALADIHACRPWMSPERIRGLVERTNRLDADIILLLGDYVGAQSHLISSEVPDAEWAREFAALKAPLGVHAILGNHEFWHDAALQKAGRGTPLARRALEAVNIPVYENDAVRLIKDGTPFWLAGLGDQLAFLPRWRHQRRDVPMGVDDLEGTLAKVSDDAPVILMAHEPDVIVRVPERVSLVLSGHTHGGQVRLLGWSPVVPSAYGNRYAYGHVREACDLIVSGGLGCSHFPLRFGVPPEILHVTIGA